MTDDHTIIEMTVTIETRGIEAIGLLLETTTANGLTESIEVDQFIGEIIMTETVILLAKDEITMAQDMIRETDMKEVDQGLLDRIGAITGQPVTVGRDLASLIGMFPNRLCIS
jgi:hypothetical protein